jgi:hypothetical protein
VGNKVSESLLITHPQLSAEADGWDPSTLTASSSALKSWRCSNGHVYETRVNDRALRNRNCAYCSNRKVLAGYNDLATTHPDIATEADGWDASTITAGSHLKRMWKCNAGHSWSTTPHSRINGAGCLICSNQQVLAGYNDLATTHPEIAAEAYGSDPTTVTKGSNTVFTWKCTSGHSYKSTVKSRSAGTGCSICSGHEVLAGYNDLATTHPEIAAEADGWDPSTIVTGSQKSLPWKCQLGHSWNAMPGNRTAKRGGSGCPVCTNRVTMPGFNDLATNRPDIAAEAHGWDPSLVLQKSTKSQNWKCPFGHLYVTTPQQRVDGHGCPVCSGRQVLVGFNDLATTNPELAAEADGWDPTTVTRGHHQKLNWKCLQGHSWQTTPNSRSNQESGCPFCSNKKILIGYNDLATTHPEIAAEADGWDPSTLSAGSNQKRLWRCHLGHLFSAKPSERTTRDSQCPTCIGRTVLIGFNDLATTNPELAAEADGWDPTTVTAGSNIKKRWRCSLGHTWNSPPGGRKRTGCPYCNGSAVWTGFNDLATLRPDIAAEADGWDPSKVRAQSGQKVKWKCPLDHTWRAAISDRFLGTGCPVCADTGFNPGDPGWLYFLRHDAHDLLQIGITNHPERRLKKHGRGGWEVIEIRGPLDGHTTREHETDILRSLRKRKAKFANKNDFSYFDGWSEAWQAESCRVTSIRELLNFVLEDDVNS